MSQSHLNPVVFLDRDGTLNASVVREGKPYPPSTVEEMQLLPGVAEACRQLHAVGYTLVVVTNQPDVGRGTQSQPMVEAMHEYLMRIIPEITCIEVCYDPGGDTPPSKYRKPAPGMLHRAKEKLGLDLSRSWMIGDRWRDVDCGHRAGCQTIFINWGYDEELREKPDFTVSGFREAAGIILARS